MVAFIGNTSRGNVNEENFDKWIASRQNLSDFSPVKVLRYILTWVLMLYQEMNTFVKWG